MTGRVRRSVLFQSTRPLRGGTLVRLAHVQQTRISIHPPLAGRDDARSGPQIRSAISIHPPLAGRDEIADVEIMLEQIFQSTRPLRGGTPADKRNVVIQVFQSTRPLRGGT